MGPTNRTPVRGAARLAAILDALPDALLLVDSTNAIVNANSAALTLFEGESAERLLGKQIIEVLPGIWRAVAAPGSGPAALPAGPSAAAFDPRELAPPGVVRRPPERMAAQRTDGGVFPAEVTTALLTEEDDSELTLLVVRDLSGVLDVEAELRRQQRQIELILRAASEGIIGVDHEGRIVLVNPAGAKILRYRAADLGGQNVHDLITHSRADGTPLPESECPLLDSVRTGAKHRAVDSVLWRSDGGPVYVDLTTAPVYEGENIIGAVMTFVDNSASRATARQASELTTVLDKELRTGLLDVAVRLRELVDYSASGYSTLPMLEEVSSDVGRLCTLSADVVDFQQSVLGALDYEPETVELSGIVDAAVSLASPAAGAAGVEIAAHCAEVELDLDPELFVRLLSHLLSDMVSVSPVGAKIVVTAARRGALARIEIRGPHTGGSPLHLPIAQAIAAKHGGTVTTHRIAGKGDTHVVEVPVAQPDGARSGKKAAADALPKREIGAGRAALNAASSNVAKPVGPATPLGSGPASSRPSSPTNSMSAGSLNANSANANLTNTGTATEERVESAADEAAEVPKANGHHTPQGAQRRRRTVPETPARIPSQQARTSLSSSGVTSIADLKPSRPRPTGDVWSKPDRRLTSEPPPLELDQSFTSLPTLPPVTASPEPAQETDPLEESGPTTPRTTTYSSSSSSASLPRPGASTAASSAPASSSSDSVALSEPWRAEPEPPPTMTPPSQTPPRGRRRAAVPENDASQTFMPVSPAPATQSPVTPVRATPVPVTPVPVAPVPDAPAQNRAEPERTDVTMRVSFVPTRPVPVANPVPEPEPEAQPQAATVDGPRLLLWPDPDEETSELLRSRGYDPVPLGQPGRLETLAANGTGAPHPFAVFVDPIAAPITRRGLRDLRVAATKAGLPVLVTAGIGCASGGQELGPDPSRLFTALCPPEVRLPRVLLVEARTDLAEAISDILERQGMQVSHATTDAESRESAVACPPDLVLLDLMQIRRRRVGVVDWLRDRGLLSRTPLVVYTAEGTDADGFDTLYLTERATDAEPAGRIGDLLAKIAP